MEPKFTFSIEDEATTLKSKFQQKNQIQKIAFASFVWQFTEYGRAEYTNIWIKENNEF